MNMAAEIMSILLCLSDFMAQIFRLPRRLQSCESLGKQLGAFPTDETDPVPMSHDIIPWAIGQFLDDLSLRRDRPEARWGGLAKVWSVGLFWSSNHGRWTRAAKRH